MRLYVDCNFARRPVPRRYENKHPASAAILPISSTGCSTPVSLLAIMMVISLCWAAARGARRPDRPGPGRPPAATVTSQPISSSVLAGSSTAWCSMLDVMTWSPAPNQAGDGEIIGLRATAGENNFRGAAAQQARPPIRGRPRPRPRFLSMMVDGRCVAELLARNRAAWPQTLREAPGWWRYCRDKRGAYRTRFYSTLRKYVSNDAGGCVAAPGRLRCERPKREPRPCQTLLPLVDGDVVVGISGPR